MALKCSNLPYAKVCTIAALKKKKKDGLFEMDFRVKSNWDVWQPHGKTFRARRINKD